MLRWLRALSGGGALRSLACHPRRGYRAPMPTEGAMHQPGESGQAAGSDAGLAGKETWSQFSRKMRFGRRRIHVIDIAAKMSYEYQMLKKMCRRRPAMRQWAVRDDYCNMSPGVVVMSPSMQAAFMKVFRLKDKSLIRRCLRDIIPVIEYRNRAERPSAMRGGPADMIPRGEPDTLNQKKRELFERRMKGENMKEVVLRDNRSQAKLRFKIRQRLIKFQRQLAVANAVSSRSVLYSEEDAIGYFLFRGAAMYAGMHRVYFELSKMLPYFVPRTMLDFGAGTGTAILAAKEVYDPGSLAYPLYRSLRQTMTFNDSAKASQLHELRYDLRRLERNNAEKKKARFMAVAALIERNEVNAADLPADLRREIAEVARGAAANKRGRLLREAHARQRAVVDGTEWEAEGGMSAAAEDEAAAAGETVMPGEEPDSLFAEAAGDAEAGADKSKDTRTWWERFVDLETDATQDGDVQARVRRRLRPLQEVTAIEPSPGMMTIGTMVLHDDVPNLTWKRYLLPEDETIQHDLVVAAYALSEMSQASQRRQMIQQLWKMTRGVLVLVEFANLNNFNLLMEARDAILEHKDVGLWDWQPTIVAPCPHEARCPLRYCKAGVKQKRMRICSTEVLYRATFVEAWARHLPLKVGIEPISYMIFARNELVPERAERREVAARAAQAASVAARDRTQRALYEASLEVKDVVFERLSDEALHRPQTGVPPRLPALPEKEVEGVAGAQALSATGGGEAASTPAPADALAEAATSTGELGRLPTECPRVVQTSNERSNKLIYPTQYPPATHRFNRGFVDAGYQRQRAITPAEMLVVREELNDMRTRVALAAPKYLRIVRDPICRGKIQATYCTPQGDLITGRVYRRFYGDRNRVGHHSTMRWQHIGGWRLLRRVKAGSLFPHDVPMYAIRKQPQVDFANTLVDVKYSTLEKTAMQYNDPLALVDTPDEELTREELRQRRRAERDAEQRRKAEEQVEQLFGVKVGEAAALSSIDARREITAQQWADAVRQARVRTVQQTKQAIPNAAKLRAARRIVTMRRRNTRREMQSNRQR